MRWYNPFGCIRFLSGGVVNAVRLTSPGIEWWCRKIGPRVNYTTIPFFGSIMLPLVGSIFSDEIKELVEMADMLNDFDLAGLEINVSCPNTEADILRNTRKVIESCKAVKQKTRFPLILKISVVHNIKEIIPEVEGIIEAISINSVPWSVIFPNRQSPLVNLGGGGVSGKVAQPYTWDLIRKLIEITSIPVVGPGVWEFSDIEKIRGIGAKAISFGSIFLRYPWRPTLFVRKDKKRR